MTAQEVVMTEAQQGEVDAQQQAPAPPAPSGYTLPAATLMSTGTPALARCATHGTPAWMLAEPDQPIETPQTDHADAPIHITLPQVPARWMFDLRLRLMSTDDREDRISLKITDDGGGYFCHIKANATADMGELDFLPALADGLVQMVEAISAEDS